MTPGRNGLRGELPMAEWDGLRARLVWCYAGPVSPFGRRPGAKRPGEMVAWLLLQGRVRAGTGESARRAGRGEWLIPVPGPLERRFSPDARLLSIRFEACWPDGQPLFSEGLPAVFPAARHPELKERTLEMARFVERRCGPRDTRLLQAAVTLPVHARLQGLFLGWLGAFVEALSFEGLTHARFGTLDERVRRGLFLIDRMPLTAPFLRDELPRALRLSASQIDRLFATHVGMTPRSYFERRLLAEARRLLGAPGLRAKEAASRLGFRSLSHFSTWFRRGTGLAPTQVR